MSEQNKALISRLKKCSGMEDFFKELKIFFEENFNNLFIKIVKVNPVPPYFINVDDSYREVTLITKLINYRESEINEGFITVNGYMIWPLKTQDEKSEHIIVFKNQIHNDYTKIKQICETATDALNIVVNNNQAGYDKSSEQNANLISQMNHDINSFLTVIKSQKIKTDDVISDKMNYIEKMTQDILYYVRELEVLDNIVDIEELINGIIQNIPIPETIEISKKVNVKGGTINLDVELVNRAIFEIIENAILAKNKKNSKIKIQADIESHKNIIFDNEFLAIRIEDNGIGINPDYLQFVKDPFFTTWKSQYHSGLGLPIANKIIEAHRGFLNIEITKADNVLITIYLPMQGIVNE